MAEPFKNVFNRSLVKQMSEHLHSSWRGFDREGFVTSAARGINRLELKERSLQITQALQLYLPEDFEQSSEILLKSLGSPLQEDLSQAVIDKQGIAGWAIMPMSHYVALYGQGHFVISMNLLREMTRRFTAEFAIRYFLLEQPKKTLTELAKWTSHEDQHVRRLVSEGTRPRLPWAMQLPQFIDDPEPVIDLLERLKDDKEEYVRRSVANNLNDISKDHPQRICDLTKDWSRDKSDRRQRLLRHACRTLIKTGNPHILKTFGFASPKLQAANLSLDRKSIRLGEAIQITLSLNSASRKTQDLLVDYIVHHKKANGSRTPKVFKWRQVKLEAGKQLIINKKHSMKKVTTRKYYTGKHEVEIMINGKSVAKTQFFLQC